MPTLIAFLIILALDIPALMLRGFVFSKLWAWFVAGPLGVPHIGIAVAIGLSMIVGMLTNREPKKGDPDTPPLLQAAGGLFQSVVFSLMAWGIGAIVASYV